MYDSFRIDEDPQELGVTLQELEAAPFGFDRRTDEAPQELGVTLQELEAASFGFDRPLPGGDPRNWRQFPSDSIVFGFDRPVPGAALFGFDRPPPGLDPEEVHFLLKLWEEGRFHPPLPGGDPEEFLFQMELYAEFLFHMYLLEDNPAGLGVLQVDHPGRIYFRRPGDKYILFGSCNNRQDPCSRVDGFRSMPAARDSANSSGYGGAALGYGGAADKGMTMVQITNLPEQVTSKHKLYELFRTFGSMTHVDILRPGGIGFVNFIKREDAERAINQVNGWCGARLTLVKTGPEQGSQYGQKMVKPGDAPECGRGWIRDTARPFWQKPIEDAPEQGLQYGQKMVKPGDAPESRRCWIRDTTIPSWQKPMEDSLVRGQNLISHTSKSEKGLPFWRKPIRDHQCQSNRKWQKPIRDHHCQSNRKWTDRNRSQFGYGRPYWKP